MQAQRMLLVGAPNGGDDGRAGGDAAQQALLQRQAARHLDALLAGHAHHVVQHARVQHLGHKPCADALDLRAPATRSVMAWLGRLVALC